MAGGKVYRKKTNFMGRPTRYQVWIDWEGRRRKKATTGAGARKGWMTKLITWLFPVNNPSRKRRRVSRAKGWNTTHLHPNMYRQNNPREHRTVDQVAAQRAKPRRKRRR